MWTCCWRGHLCCWLFRAWLAVDLQLPESLEKISFPARDLLQKDLHLGCFLAQPLPWPSVQAVFPPPHDSWRAQTVFPVVCGSVRLVSLLPIVKPSVAIPRGSPSFFCCVSSKGIFILRLLRLKILISQLKWIPWPLQCVNWCPPCRGSMWSIWRDACAMIFSPPSSMPRTKLAPPCSLWFVLMIPPGCELPSFHFMCPLQVGAFFDWCTLIHWPAGCDVSNNLLKSKQIMSHVFFLSGVCVTSLKNSSRFVKQDLPFIRLCWQLFVSAHVSPDVLWSHHLLMSP